MKGKTRSYLSIIAAAVMWGCIGFFLRLLTGAGLTAMQAVCVRILLSAVLYTLWLLITDRGALKIRLRDCWYFIGTGICSLVFFNWCYFSTIELSGMAVAAVLLYTSPIFVTLMSAIFFKERLTPVKLLALVLTFGGCLLVTGLLGQSSCIPTAAMVLGLGSGFLYALYSIFGKVALGRYSAKTVTAYTFIFGSLGVLPFVFVNGIGTGVLTLQGGLGALGMAVICCILPFMLYTSGLEHIEPGRASVVATLEPVVAALMGLLFGQTLGLAQLAGMALVIAAICILNLGDRVKKKDHKCHKHSKKSHKPSSHCSPG